MRWLKANPDDALLVGGCVCIVSGMAMWSIPAALVVAGVLLIGLGLLVGKKMVNDGAVEKPAE